MSEHSDEQRLADRLAALHAAGAVPMTAEEVLAGATQSGVPRPAFLRDHEDDGTIETVGLAKVIGDE